MAETLLSVKDLQINFYVKNGISKIINNLELDFEAGSFLGLVGESGSGKSVFANAMLGYVKTPGKIERGIITYKDRDVLQMSEDELLHNFRGKDVGLIASNARAHLNPLLTVGEQLSIVYRTHTGASKKASRERALEMLNLVKINDPKRRLDSYPHELSGGMAQRIMIAMTLINTPNLIIADDCTNGLDVTVAAQIMDLFLDVIATQKASSILITHDLGIVAQCCTDIAIIYWGQIIEKCSVRDFFKGCAHPYSEILLRSLPERAKKYDGASVPNVKINTLELPTGCLFYDKCRYRTNECLQSVPELTEITKGHFVKCLHPLARGMM